MPAPNTDEPAAPPASEITRCPASATAAAQGWVRSATKSTRSPGPGAGTDGPKVSSEPTTVVHGPSRPTSDSGQSAGGRSGTSSASGSSGSASGRFSCTGPATPPAPLAAPTARHTIARQAAFCPETRCATANSWKNRSAGPNSDCWSMAWLAPTSRSHGGRSAESTSSGTPPWCASSTAGCRLATAVPEVVTTTAGRPDPGPARRRGSRPCVRRSARAAAADRWRRRRAVPWTAVRSGIPAPARRR